MRPKFPWPLGTLVFVVALLGVTLYWSVFCNGWGLLASFLFTLTSLIWLLASILRLFIDRSKKTICRILIIITGVVLILPVLDLGSSIRIQLFLANIAYYQATVDRFSVAKNASTEPQAKRIPIGFSSSLVEDSALIERDTDSSFTIFFTNRDSSAVGHSGFLYRSDDNPKAVTREKPDVGLRRIAAKWYLWGS